MAAKLEFNVPTHMVISILAANYGFKVCDATLIVAQGIRKKLEDEHNILEMATKSSSSFVYNKKTIRLDSVLLFNQTSTRVDNDRDNKVREAIVEAIINQRVPQVFYKQEESNSLIENWVTLRKQVMAFVHSITGSHGVVSVKAQGGRNYHYDFDLIHELPGGKIQKYRIEFKCNSMPQFVSPMRPSQYFSANYEEFYYDNYLPLVWAKLGEFTSEPVPPMPSRETYVRDIHTNKPQMVAELKRKYSSGCLQSPQFTGNARDIEFYEWMKKTAKHSINTFIENTELNLECLSTYFKETQKGKIYMIYKNGHFEKEHVNMDDFELVSCVKNPKLSRYEVKTKTNLTINILLRWKNGNGVAYPALQVSKQM